MAADARRSSSWRPASPRSRGSCCAFSPPGPPTWSDPCCGPRAPRSRRSARCSSPCAREFTLLESLVAGAAAGAGLLVALSILAGIEDRLAPGEAPSVMSGLPRALVSAGLAALAFAAFDRVFLAGLVR